MNCDVHQELCSQHRVRGYPTLSAWVPGSSGKLREYSGQRSASAIRDWVLGQLPDTAVTRVGTPTELRKLMGQCVPGSRAASSGLCVLLVTDKPETSSLYKALALAYKGKVRWAAIVCGSATALTPLCRFVQAMWGYGNPSLILSLRT